MVKYEPKITVIELTRSMRSQKFAFNARDISRVCKISEFYNLFLQHQYNINEPENEYPRVHYLPLFSL